jgi:hypothetical protein
VKAAKGNAIKASLAFVVHPGMTASMISTAKLNAPQLSSTMIQFSISVVYIPGKVRMMSFRLDNAHIAITHPNIVWYRVLFLRQNKISMAKMAKNAVEAPIKSADMFM